jgi:hypothetical protein
LKHAAKAIVTGNDPDAEDYAQIYFEHPNCSGGVETHKLFAPYAIRDLLTGCAPDGSKGYSYVEVLESMMQAGFWFWPDRLKAPIHAIAARLFWDWFRGGHYAWVKPDYGADDLLGPGDDILTLCSLGLIDPYDLVRTLVTSKTPQADDALTCPLNFLAQACTYVALDTYTQISTYQTATEVIAAILAKREALAFKDYVTPELVGNVFFKYAQTHPKMAQEISEFGRYYEVRMANTFERAANPVIAEWPEVPDV